MSVLLEALDLQRRFGAVQAVAGLSLELGAGEIHALIGPNGAGKSTAIGLLSGEIRPDAGNIRLEGRDIGGLSMAARARAGLARSFQVTRVFADFTALENVALAVQATLPGRFGVRRAAMKDEAITAPARALLDEVGLGGEAERPARLLSHGARRQLELAMVLAIRPRAMLLDEPMAGLGSQERHGMADLLASLRSRCGMLLVEHDMDVVFRLADRISVLVGGRLIASGAPDAIREDPAVRRAYLDEGDA